MTMGEVTKLEQPKTNIAAGGKVGAIVPQNFEDVYRVANAVCKAGMAPQGLDTPERAMVAIMHGLETGLTPMAALQSIAVVNGRPSIWGDGAIGLVRGSGLCEYIRETLDESDPDNPVATCEAKRKGEEPTIRTFSRADAETAGLWGKKGPWTQYPKRMLQLRARAFALRDAFADVLKGLHIAEEVQDIPPGPEHARDVTPPAPPPVREAIEDLSHEPEKEGMSENTATPEAATTPPSPVPDEGEQDWEAWAIKAIEEIGKATDKDSLDEAWVKFVETDINEVPEPYLDQCEKARVKKMTEFNGADASTKEPAKDTGGIDSSEYDALRKFKSEIGMATTKDQIDGTVKRWKEELETLHDSIQADARKAVEEARERVKK